MCLLTRNMTKEECPIILKRVPFHNNFQIRLINKLTNQLSLKYQYIKVMVLDMLISHQMRRNSTKQYHRYIKLSFMVVCHFSTKVKVNTIIMPKVDNS